MIFIPSMGFISETPSGNPMISSTFSKSSLNYAAPSQSMKLTDHKSVVNILSRLEEEAILFNQTCKRPLYAAAQKKRHSLPVTPLDTSTITTSLAKTALSKGATPPSYFMKKDHHQQSSSDMFERNPYDLQLNLYGCIKHSHVV